MFCIFLKSILGKIKKIYMPETFYRFIADVDPLSPTVLCKVLISLNPKSPTMAVFRIPSFEVGEAVLYL